MKRMMLVAAAVGALGVFEPSADGAAARMSDYTLTISGSCPGRISLEWSGALPDGRQAIVYGAETGKTVIPHGPCQGTVLGLGGYVAIVNIIGTGSGEGVVYGNMGSGRCGVYCQFVELGTCRPSNVAQTP